MAAYGTVEVEGMATLRRTLRKAGNDLQDLRTAHAKVASYVVGQTHAPAVTGRLAHSVRGSGTKTAAILRSGNNSGVRYANPIHWGWGRRNIAANPFLSRAASQTEPTWYPLYVDAVQKVIDQVRGV